MAAERELDVKYINGLTGYMKTQNRGRFPDWTRTPANAYN
jgi:hypothetical protein